MERQIPRLPSQEDSWPEVGGVCCVVWAGGLSAVNQAPAYPYLLLHVAMVLMLLMVVTV